MESTSAIFFKLPFIEEKRQNAERLKVVIAKVPKDIWLTVFSFLPATVKPTVSLVCKFWKALAQDARLWNNGLNDLWYSAIEKFQTDEWKTTKANLDSLCLKNKILKWEAQEEVSIADMKGFTKQAQPSSTEFKILKNHIIWISQNEQTYIKQLECWNLEDFSKETITKEGFEPIGSQCQFSETTFIFSELIGMFEHFNSTYRKKCIYDIQTKEWRPLSGDPTKHIFFDRQGELCLTLVQSEARSSACKVTLWDANTHKSLKEMDYEIPYQPEIRWNADFLIFLGTRFTEGYQKSTVDIFEIKKTFSFVKLASLELDRLDKNAVVQISSFDLSGSILFIATRGLALFKECLEGRFWVLSNRVLEGPRFTFKEENKVSLIKDLFLTINYKKDKKTLTSTINFFNSASLLSAKKFSDISSRDTLTINGYVTQWHFLKSDTILLINCIKTPILGQSLLSETFQVYKVVDASVGKRKNPSRKVSNSKKPKSRSG